MSYRVLRVMSYRVLIFGSIWRVLVHTPENARLGPKKSELQRFRSALLAFCDGRFVGAILDRNGLRPARYYLTSDDHLYLSSEVGVIDLPDELVIKKVFCLLFCLLFYESSLMRVHTYINTLSLLLWLYYFVPYFSNFFCSIFVRI